MAVGGAGHRQPSPTIATDSEGGDSDDNDDNESEEGAAGGGVFQNGIGLSREEDGGRVESMAEAFKNLNMVDPRRKKGI